MRARTAAPLALVALVVAGGHASADAKPKNLSKTYKLTLSPAPIEVPLQDTSCSSANRTKGANLDVKAIKVEGPGKLKASVSGFDGDWDMAVYSKAGVSLADGSGTSTPDAFSTPATPLSETVTYKSKKAQTLYLRVCNYVGTQNATVKYTYTYS
jgi:hypothetical protein